MVRRARAQPPHRHLALLLPLLLLFLLPLPSRGAPSGRSSRSIDSVNSIDSTNSIRSIRSSHSIDSVNFLSASDDGGPGQVNNDDDPGGAVEEQLVAVNHEAVHSPTPLVGSLRPYRHSVLEIGFVWNQRGFCEVRRPGIRCNLVGT